MYLYQAHSHMYFLSPHKISTIPKTCLTISFAIHFYPVSNDCRAARIILVYTHYSHRTETSNIKFETKKTKKILNNVSFSSSEAPNSIKIVFIAKYVERKKKHLD